LWATLASRLQAENQEELATKERKDHKESREQVSSVRSLRSFAANAFSWPGLAGMREFRTAASLFLLFEGVIRRN
jgi:hypothetical protein